MKTAIQWQYKEHASRWVIVLFGLGNAAYVTDSLFRHEHTNSNSLIALSVVVAIFSLVVAVLFLRPPVSGHMNIVDGNFSFDTGRPAPDALRAVSFPLQVLRSGNPLTLDIRQTQKLNAGWLFPRRKIFAGSISDISNIQLKSIPIGAEIVVTFHSGIEARLRDLSGDVVQVYDALRAVLQHSRNSRI